MKSFMDENFILSNETAQILYHGYAKETPIIDYHCHISPQEIAEDKCFENITELWLGGDHYKWRLMRSNGVEEKYITGDGSAWEKFREWAGTLERAIGNPLFHWSHLELKRYFDYDGVLNRDTAKEVWKLCNEKITNGNMSAKWLVRKSNVKVIGTTDDPIDSLEWHQIIAKDTSFQTKVLPMWRPDRAVGIEKTEYLAYLGMLGEVAGIEIHSFAELKKALKRRLDYFDACGCTGSDHGMLYVPYQMAEDSVVEEIFRKRQNNQEISNIEELQFKTACLLFLGEEYKKRNWVMQLHIGVTRDNNELLFAKLGADTGFDSIYNRVPLEQLSSFLNKLNKTDSLPRVIIYSLNPNDNATIGTLMGCFQDAGTRGKVQHGSAWWFNDHEAGMREQMTSLANLGVLGNFIGMLTDSRSFLSYTRHEYFRRILCDMVGNWIETGRYPADVKKAGQLITDICYNNVNQYFGFQV